MRRMFVRCLLVVLVTAPVCAEQEALNSCQDQDSWAEWDAAITQSPEDSEFQMLHTLRLGLCLKIARNDLSVAEATTIFERARNTLIQKRKDHPQMPPQPSPF